MVRVVVVFRFLLGLAMTRVVSGLSSRYHVSHKLKQEDGQRKPVQLANWK